MKRISSPLLDFLVALFCIVTCVALIVVVELYRSSPLATAPSSQLSARPIIEAALARSLGKDDISYHLQKTRTKYVASNKKNGFTTEFSGSGATIKTNSSAFSIALTGASYTRPSTAQNVITYNRGTFTEWYVNSPIGLEQGFTLHAPIDLNLTISGAKSIFVDSNGLGVSLLTQSGSQLRYQSLYAYDANGARVPALFRQTSKNTLTIALDDSHAVYPITVDPYVQEQKITASDGTANDSFGYVTSFDSTATRVAISAVGSSANTGAVYVFVRSGTGWTLEQKIVADDAATDDQFGYGLAMDSTSTRMVVGANNATIGGNVAQGAAYIFTRSGALWTQEQKITATGGAADDGFGNVVAIDSTGTRVVVGASLYGATNTGSAYVFIRSGTSWAQEQQLTATGAAANDVFSDGGISLDSAGARVAIGATGVSSNTGATYVFTRSGALWTQEQKITATGGIAGNRFGTVDMDSAGTRIAVGAWGGNSGTGTAYVFSRSGTIWAQEQQLTSSNIVSGDAYGWGVSINGDGSIVFIGAFGTNSNAGSLYVFSRIGTVWTQYQVLTPSDLVSGDFLGVWVDVDSTGTYLVAGADGANSFMGAAYVFNLSTPTGYACHPEWPQCGSRYVTPTPLAIAEVSVVPPTASPTVLPTPAPTVTELPLVVTPTAAPSASPLSTPLPIFTPPIVGEVLVSVPPPGPRVPEESSEPLQGGESIFRKIVAPIEEHPLTASTVALTLFSAAPLLAAISHLLTTRQIAPIWGSLKQVVGLKKKSPVWGVVYDTRTKHPIPFCKLQLVDEQNRVLETRYADRDGRYGFLIGSSSPYQKAGQVKIVAVKKGFSFPSSLSATSDFLVYDNLYHGEYLSGSSKPVIFNIPMDPKAKEHPDFAALSLLSFGHLSENLLNLGFIIGAFVSPLSYLINPSTTNLVITTVFFGVNILRISLLQRPYGVITDAKTGKPMPYALITAEDSSGKRIGFAVSDEHGRYFISVPKHKEYRLTVHTPAGVVPFREIQRLIPRSSRAAVHGWVVADTQI